MAQRTTETANLHDRVVRNIVRELNQQAFDVYINPGQEKSAGIGDNYPDVIMCEKNTKKVRFILEVETADTVTKDEAENQWKKYANEIKATFYIVVPESAAFKAKELCQQFEVNARFATFSVDDLGALTFDFK